MEEEIINKGKGKRKNTRNKRSVSTVYKELLQIKKNGKKYNRNILYSQDTKY